MGVRMAAGLASWSELKSVFHRRSVSDSRSGRSQGSRGKYDEYLYCRIFNIGLSEQTTAIRSKSLVEYSCSTELRTEFVGFGDLAIPGSTNIQD